MGPTARKALKRLVGSLKPYCDLATLPVLVDYHLSPRAQRSIGDLPYDRNLVQQELEGAGLCVEDYWVDVPRFRAWLDLAGYPEDYRVLYGPLFLEKALEHFMSLELLQPSPGSILIDVGNAESPFPDIAMRLHGCEVYRNDLKFAPGMRKVGPNLTEIGGNAAHLPIPSEAASSVVLHCALESFEGDSDIGLIREAARVLKPGGRLLILPLHLHERYIIYRDPAKNGNGVQYDERAEVIYRPNFVRFCRFYSVPVFLERIVSNSNGLSLKVLAVKNAIEVSPTCDYFRFGTIFEKR